MKRVSVFAAVFIMSFVSLSAKENPALIWSKGLGQRVNSVYVSSDGARVAASVDPMMLVRAATIGSSKLFYFDEKGKVLWEYANADKKRITSLTFDAKENLIRGLIKPAKKKDMVFFNLAEVIPDVGNSNDYWDLKGRLVREEAVTVSTRTENPAGDGLFDEGENVRYSAGPYTIYRTEIGKGPKLGNTLYNKKSGEPLYFLEEKFRSEVNGVYYFDENNVYLHIHSPWEDKLILVDVPNKQIKWKLKINLKNSEYIAMGVSSDRKRVAIGQFNDVFCYEDAGAKSANVLTK